MNMDEIIRKHEDLKKQLIFALSTMERKSVIEEIRLELINLQNQCPHFSQEHNYTILDGKCPYCGRVLFGGTRND